MSWRSFSLVVALLFGSFECNAQGAATAQIERGRYLTTAGDCVSCHTPPNGRAFAGGRAFATPFGTIYSTNITPDDVTGIGKWTAADLRHAMHEGVDPTGRRLFPAFPYTSFTKISDQDVDDIYAYLRSLTPTRSVAADNGVLLRARWPLALWNAMYFKAARFVPVSSRSAEWNRGAYLVEGLGHCGACHSPRNFLMAEIPARAYAGSVLLDEVATDKIGRWSAVNLTSSRQGLAAWSVDDLAKYLKSGFAARAGSFGPMNEVIVNSLSKLTPEDLRAMAVYIKTLPAQSVSAADIAADQAKDGAAVYKDRCEKCHLASGRGGLFSGPPLAGSAVVQSDDPASLINIILYGPRTPKEISLGAWETMKAYAGILDDAQVAAVASYVRGNWGNRAGPASPSDVARQR